MPRQIVFAIVGITALSVGNGCALLNQTQEFTRQSFRAMTPRSSDYYDPSEAVEDDWSIVGHEGRGDTPLEQDPDPWWGKYIMSPKARAIEQNLGFQY